jgi:drug/metabolite transporter (DMT)-like permease
MNYKFGIAVGIVSTFFYSLMDTLIKYLEINNMISNDALFFQGSLIIFVILLLSGIIYYKKMFYITNIKATLCRAIITFMNFYLAFYVLKYIPLDIYYSIIFTVPTIASVLAVFFLKEKFNVAKVSALFIGFVGVLIISNPFAEDFNNSYIPYILLTLLLAFTTALSGLITRKYLSKENSFAVSFYIILLCVILGFIISGNTQGIKTTLNFDYSIFGLMLALCLCWIIGLLLFLKAYQITPLQIIAPTEYTFIIWGIMLSYIVFDYQTSLIVMTGCSLIICSNFISVFFNKE